jgi:Cu/Ag efflux protein CusF
MNIALVILTLAFGFTLVSCGSSTVANNTTSKNVAVSPTPASRGSVPKDGEYSGTGVVTNVNTGLSSIELDHEEIKDLMPAMKMEFFVSDKKLLDELKVGDKVDFVIRYKDPTETIVGIKKVQ